MKFKFHVYVQKHRNRTYTATVLPFFDIADYGNSLEEIKAGLAESVKNRILQMPAVRLHQLEFDPRVYLQRVHVELRPMDRKKRNRRREKVRMDFSVLVKPQDDGQLFVSIPRLAPNGPSFYVYNANELQHQSEVELAAWFDSYTLDQLQEYQYARSEMLETLEVIVPIKKPKERDRSPGHEERSPFGNREEESFWALREFGINMTAQAAELRLRRAYRRDDIVRQIAYLLSQPRNNSVLLFGDSESGKTAIVQEVVRCIASKDVPDALHGRQVWMLAPDRIIAGAQYIGTWEERIGNLVNECRKRQHILYVTDLPGLLEIGRWSKSDSNVAQALKPHIATGDVVIIGETSLARLEVGERLGPDFMHQFRRLEVPSMSEDETQSVLRQVTRDLEREYDIRIDPAAIDASTQLSRRFLPYRAFPGKAIRLLEEAIGDVLQTGADQQHRNEDDSLMLFRRAVPKTIVQRQHVLLSFARQSGMPEFIINDRTRLDLNEVERYFLSHIAGQDHVVSAMVNLVAMVKAGLNDPHQPLGTFLFIGPTGVGKTHMAKTLARYLFGHEDRLIRFDMSEYGDVDGGARLIGAFSSEGELTRRVRAQPFSVILLDEFEKASPRIFDVLLQVLGEGHLTDAAGRISFFHNSIVILTSNLGSDSGSISGFGFGRDALSHAEINAMLVDHYRDQIERYFRPEFVNRIDQIVVFKQLDHQALRHIASRELRQVLKRDGITRRNLLVEIDDSVIELVLENGYSPQYGARPLKREIERRVVAPLARQLAERSADDKELLRVTIGEDGQHVMLKAVPILDVTTSVSLVSESDPTDMETIQIDGKQLVEGFAMLRRKLSDWLDSDTVGQMVSQKAAILAATQSTVFWERSAETHSRLSRLYFLDRVMATLRELHERCEYLEDLAVLVERERDVRYHSDLVRDYQELQRDVSYLEIEMQTGHLPHRHQAMMLLRRLGQNQRQDGDVLSWPVMMARMYLEWATRKGYGWDVYVLQSAPVVSGQQSFRYLNAGELHTLLKQLSQLSPVEELAIGFEGNNVFGFLKGERGIHRYQNSDNGYDAFCQIQVFAIPDRTPMSEWLGDYVRIKSEIEDGMRPAPPIEQHAVVRLYRTGKAGERIVQDPRTGMRTTRIQDVMEKGRLDEFILALLRQGGTNVDWEDRFPTTFPF